jgi:hypothetical protein
MANPSIDGLDPYPGGGEVAPADFVVVRNRQRGRDFRAQVSQIGGSKSANDARGVDKRVRFETAAQLSAAGGPSAGDCLAELNDETFCLGMLAWVEFATRGYGVTFRLMYDGTPRTPANAGVRAYRTGHMVAGDRLPAKWVRQDDPIAGVPTYAYLQSIAPPAGWSFAIGDPIRDFASTGAEYFFAAKNAGVLPAPTSPDGDTNWRRIAPEEVGPVPSSYFRRITQAEAVAMDGDEEVSPGVRYAVELGQGRYVEFVGTEAKRFPTFGVLNGEQVLANVHNGYVEVTGPEQVTYADLLGRFADTPPIAGKLYGITARPGGGAAVLCRFDDLTAWAPGGVAPGMLVATGARVVGQPGTFTFDLKANTTTASGGGTSTDPNALPAPVTNGVRTVTVDFNVDAVVTLATGRGFSGPNNGASDRNFFEGNWELRAYGGADAKYKAFADSNGYAIIRKDYLEKYVAEAIAAIPAYTELGIDFPSAGAQSRDVRIKDQRFVGTASVLTTTGGMTNLSFKLNGTVVSLPVAVALNNVLTVSGSMPTGGGVVTLNIS